MSYRIITILALIIVSARLFGQPEPLYNDTSYFIEYDDDFNLIMSASKGHLKNVQNLLDRGADINAVTIDNISSLMYATENGDFLMVRLLLENGANPNLKPFNGITALISATRLNYQEIAEFLINNGAKINDADEEGVTAIHYAAAYNYADLIEMLLFYGADPEKPDKKGVPPIITAAYNNSLESLKILVENGVDPETRDREGFTPLMTAVSQNNNEVANYLLSINANVNSANKGAMTPLAFAIMNGNYEMTQKLIAEGADVNHRINTSQNILELAKARDEDEIVDLLESEDADPNYFPGFTKFGIGPALDFNGDDFITTLDFSFLDFKYNTGINTGFGFRPVAIRIRTDPVNDTLFQYWERRYYVYAGLEKKIALISPGYNVHSGPYLSLNTFYTFGGYRGSIKKAKAGIVPSFQAGWYYMSKIVLLRFGYQYLDFKENINPHRLKFSLLFTIKSKSRKTVEKNIEWLNIE